MAEKADNLISGQMKALAAEEPTNISDVTLSHIRKEIRQTEAEMAATLVAIEEKLKPSYLLDQAKEKIMESVLRRSEAMMEATGSKISDVGGAIRQKVENNPIPVTLLGLGLGWLMVDAWKRREERHGWMGGRYYGGDREEALQEYHESELYPTDRSAPQPEHVGQAGHVAKETSDKPHRGYSARVEQKMRHYGQEAQHQVGELKERAHHLSGEARYQYRRARLTFSQMIQEHPLVLGAAALAAGALAGLLIPETHREHEWMGEARETFLKKGAQLGRELKEKAVNVAREAGRAAADEAEKQQLTAEGTLEKVENVVDKAVHTASEKINETVKSSYEGV